MKKITALVLVLVLALSVFACSGDPKPTQLGSSDLSIVLPDGYKSAEDDMDEDQVAYYYKDDDSVDFDVYQWEKDSQYTLAAEAQIYATMYGAVATAVTVNEISGYKYVSTENYEGTDYTVVNYMFEDDTYIVEICFWTDGSDAENKVVNDIINTLKKD